MRLITSPISPAVKDLPVSKDVAYLLTMWGIPLTDLWQRHRRGLAMQTLMTLSAWPRCWRTQRPPPRLYLRRARPVAVFLEAVKNVSEYVCIVT